MLLCETTEAVGKILIDQDGHTEAIDMLIKMDMGEWNECAWAQRV